MLRARDVQKLSAHRHDVNRETYRQLYADVVAKIEYRASMGEHGLRHVVPQLVPGRPAFNVDHATRYIHAKLTRGGFAVERPEPSVLDVDWTPKRTKKPDRQSQNATRDGNAAVKRTSVHDDRLAALRRVSATAFGPDKKSAPPA